MSSLFFINKYLKKTLSALFSFVHGYFVIYNPNHTAATPIMQLVKIYNKARSNWFDCIRFSVSFANVEKVVNPPQKPTASNSFKLLLVGMRPMNKPMQKHPSMLIINVAKGNDAA